MKLYTLLKIHNFTHRLQLFFLRFGRKYKIAAVSLSIFVLAILMVHVIIVRAIGPTDTVAIEPETGTLTGPVSINTDPTASNGQYVQFTAIATPTPTPIPVLTITNLTIADTKNANKYSVQANMQVGNLLFGDRTYTLQAVPGLVAGSQWIRTADNSKSWNAGVTLISFTINKQATVFVGVDQRLKKLPWMDATWVATGVKLLDSELHPISFPLFQKTFPAGTVTLGPNAGGTASNMYTVILH